MMLTNAEHLTIAELDRGLDEIRQSPSDGGNVQMLVRRPQTDAREMLTSARLDTEVGLVGDNWHASGVDAHLDMQLTLMNTRVIALIARNESRWSLAGDQIYLDMDLSVDNLPIGSQLAIGDAIVEISSLPHLGCRKFADRYGADAVRFVNSETGKQLRLRGVNARVVRSGDIAVGDVARKVHVTNA
jgi:MOSC domain-containing protein YiiM